MDHIGSIVGPGLILDQGLRERGLDLIPFWMENSNQIPLMPHGLKVLHYHTSIFVKKKTFNISSDYHINS